MIVNSLFNCLWGFACFEKQLPFNDGFKQINIQIYRYLFIYIYIYASGNNKSMSILTTIYPCRPMRWKADAIEGKI